MNLLRRQACVTQNQPRGSLVRCRRGAGEQWRERINANPALERGRLQCGLMLICLLAVPCGVWLGWRLHARLDQRQMYRACYGLLVVTALKLLWDGVGGYMA